jgi:ABC-type nitrate/sulfonate/bicarbonate transport system permease component
MTARLPSIATRFPIPKVALMPLLLLAFGFGIFVGIVSIGTWV